VVRRRLAWWLLVAVVGGCGWHGLDLALEAGAGPDGAIDRDGAGGDDDAAAAPDARADGLVARFPMDDDPALSGMVKGEPLAVSAACPTTCPAPTSEHMVGTGGYRFDGTVRVELGPILDTAAPYSITLWLAADVDLPFGSALSKPLDLSTRLNEVSLTVGNDAVTFEGTRGGLIAGPLEPGDLRGAWHHVGLVFEGGDRVLLIDGVERGRAAGPWSRSALPFAIGGDLDAGAFAFGFVGELDDLRFYARALSAAEVAAVAAER